MYYKTLRKVKEDLISDIQKYADGGDERDKFDGYEFIHYREFHENHTEFIPVNVRQYRKDCVLAYTDNDYLIKLYHGKRRKNNWLEEYEWDPLYQMAETFHDVGDYIVKIPYEKIILEDLFKIASRLHDEYCEHIQNFIETLDDED